MQGMVFNRGNRVPTRQWYKGKPLAIALVLVLSAVTSLDLMLPATAWAREQPDFSHLDEAAAHAAVCDAKATDVYETGENPAILMALNEQGKCLEVILFSVAREFYDSNAFGKGGVEARISEVRHSLAQLYSTIYSEPRTCAPNCGEVYQIWAAEAYVTSIRIMLDDMIDRLKDESPLHRP